MTEPLRRFVPSIHPHIPRHAQTKPVKVADQLPQNLNGRIALVITKGVGTMWCAYAFTVLALIALPPAISGGILTTIQWLSQTFIQLVMLSVIMVGQNLLSRVSDKRADETYQDAEATLHEAQQIQDHLKAQDDAIGTLLDKLAKLEAARGQA